MAFTCLPMIPTCFLTDLIELLEYVLPAQVTFPTVLQTSQNCLSDPSQSSCVKKCSEPPTNFKDWRDTLAFAVCYTSDTLCDALAEIAPRIDAKLAVQLTAKKTMNDTLLSANIFCFFVTFTNIVPVLLLGIVALSMVGYILYVPSVVLPKLTTLLLQSVMTLHAE
jgi:hypothetical protein